MTKHAAYRSAARRHSTLSFAAEAQLQCSKVNWAACHMPQAPSCHASPSQLDCCRTQTAQVPCYAPQAYAVARSSLTSDTVTLREALCGG